MLVPITDIGERILNGLRDGTLPTSNRFECQFCFNSGYKPAIDRHDRRYKGVVKCFECAYWQFRKLAEEKRAMSEGYQHRRY